MAQNKSKKAAGKKAAEDAHTATVKTEAKPEEVKVSEATAPAEGAKAPEAETGAQGTTFDQAVEFVLRDRIEGGYVNDPRDPGGETNFGISKRSHPTVNVRDLTREAAIAIYKSEYWDAAGCEALPPKLAVAVFDCAVNQGVGISSRLLQKAAGVAADGVIGPRTIGAIERANEEDLVIQFLGWRLRRYAFTANASTYMRGWANRVLLLERFLLLELKVA